MTTTPPVTASHRNGALAVVMTLAAHGVDTIFGIPGTHNLELYRHLRSHRIRAVTPRHEQGAGYAADGYYLVSGRPGVVITTSGPGLLNAVTAAATAYAESRPMLLISPGVPLGQEGADLGLLHETKDASGGLGRLLVASHRVHSPTEAAQAIADAFAYFSANRPGPIHIEVPLDVLEGQCEGAPAGPRATAPAEPAPAAVAAAAEVLAVAERPLIILGGGARGCATAATSLAEMLDAPVLTTVNGKGIVPESHPLAAGSNIRFAAFQAATAAADVLLVVGSELGDSDLWGGTAGAGPGERQQVIRVDIDPDQLDKNLAAEVPVCADSGTFLDTLLPRVSQASRTGPAIGAARVARLRAAAAAEFDFDSIGCRITRILAESAGPEVIIAGDSSQVTYNGTVHALTAHRDDQLLYMPGFATLGYGIPAAIGAKLAAPERHVACLLGDGAAMFSIAEIVTARELGLGIPFIVVDNGGYAEIEQQMRERDLEPLAVRLTRPDFSALGQAMGAHGLTLAESRIDADLAPAISAALTRSVPSLIHVVVGD